MNMMTDKEEQIMQILWQLEKAFVKEIREQMEKPQPPVTTISSIVRKLEEKGYVGHDSFGKAHRYFPILKKEDYRKKSMKKLMLQYFEGSPEQLLSFFVKEEEIDIETLNGLLHKIKQQEENE